MSASRVEVLAVPRGSVVWLRNIAGLNLSVDPITGEEIPGFLDDFMAELIAKVGHTQFCVLATEGDGTVEVVGEDEIVDRVRQALENR